MSIEQIDHLYLSGTPAFKTRTAKTYESDSDSDKCSPV
jgi:hypothetical protein